MTDRARLIAVARGDEPPDLVVEGAEVFSVFTKEWLRTDVAVAEGRIAGFGTFEGGERIDGSGHYLVPGFIDAHVHIESSKLMMDEFARAVLPHGTTAVVCDPHEIANVLGTDGVHWMIDFCKGLPIDVFVMASSCVPASRYESPRRALTHGDLQAILRRNSAIGLAEMMNFPGVVSGDVEELGKLDLEGAAHADGHAPGLTGHALDAYIASGIRSDHEATTLDEAIEKRRKGMWVLIREASNARNLLSLLPMVLKYGPEHSAFCTDDREPDMLVREGHINQMCRVAVEKGIPAEDALLLASLHPARYHRLYDRGAVAPGYLADFMLLPDLTEFRPHWVFKSGRLVVDEGRVVPFPRKEVPMWVRNTVRNAPVGAEDLQLVHGGSKIRVIEIVPEQLLTLQRVEEPTVRDGKVVADPGRDLAKIAVIERHHATGRIGKGFVTGFGLEKGAFASTVAHDAHNIVVVGVDDEDMITCIDRLAATGGGIVAAQDGEVLAELPLPVAGLLSDQPIETVVSAMDDIHDALKKLGVFVSSPFMTLSFLALSVIPALKITDLGLIDVSEFKVVPLEV